jgi:hypothetical protein
MNIGLSLYEWVAVGLWLIILIGATLVAQLWMD